MNVAVVVGTRPEFIQIDPVYRELKKRGAPVLIHTGQHYDYEMSRRFFEELDIPEPDQYLGIGSGSHPEQIGRGMLAMERVLKKERPDMLLREIPIPPWWGHLPA